MTSSFLFELGKKNHNTINVCPVISHLTRYAAIGSDNTRTKQGKRKREAKGKDGVALACRLSTVKRKKNGLSVVRCCSDNPMFVRPSLSSSACQFCPYVRMSDVQCPMSIAASKSPSFSLFEPTIVQLPPSLCSPLDWHWSTQMTLCVKENVRDKRLEIWQRMNKGPSRPLLFLVFLTIVCILGPMSNVSFLIHCNYKQQQISKKQEGGYLKECEKYPGWYLLFCYGRAITFLHTFF